ncbi:hypothetical protein Bca52824_095167 [Brassica carinata]|uniref:Uncharacterized protein n=1 Tax=Brassica carinata TaxID=52824 RepID=A0A8X7TIH1_BRACI|nr:hypothetical protein Bca52824_095167 [Brassica carinata]
MIQDLEKQNFVTEVEYQEVPTTKNREVKIEVKGTENQKLVIKEDIKQKEEAHLRGSNSCNRCEFI